MHTNAYLLFLSRCLQRTRETDGPAPVCLAAASPPNKPGSLLRTSIEGLKRLSVGTRRASAGSDTLEGFAGQRASPAASGDLDSRASREGSYGNHPTSREGSYGKHHQRLPETALQSGTPPSAMRAAGDGDRVHGGKAGKSVAFSDSARDASPLEDA